jgi:hypothetical protein
MLFATHHAAWSQSIRGSITTDGATPTRSLNVHLWKQAAGGSSFAPLSSTTSDPATGEYEFLGLPDGLYQLQVTDPLSFYAPTFYDDACTQLDAAVVEIAAGTPLIDPVNIAVRTGGVIEGIITSGGAPPGHSLVVALWTQNPITLIYDQDTNETSSGVSDGYYRFSGLCDGNYIVQVEDHTGVFASEYYQDSYTFESAKVITIQGGVANTLPANFVVEQGAAISGRVLGNDGTNPPYPVEGISVGISEVVGSGIAEFVGGFVGVNTDANGDFTIGLRPGAYSVDFFDYTAGAERPTWASQIYSNTIARQWGSIVNLPSAGTRLTNINAMLVPGYSISGTVTDTNDMPLEKVFASFEVYREGTTNEWGSVVAKKTDVNGEYAVSFPPGVYRVKFEEDSMLYEQEYWSAAELAINATPINIVNADIGGIDAQLAHTPLARWAFSYGINPFANVAGWLKEDPDSDTYNNFNEFAFGTDPTNASSGNPIQIGQVVSNSVTFSARFHQNLSTAYWLEYELCQTASVIAWPACVGVGPATNLSASDPIGYENASITVPVGVGQVLQQYFRLKATLHP